ncbi:unnamed protein product [Anisakis simplex]|uniref:Uncharacterized protein n=1 Tax=Anisakis simplex TaxID=6269 RepID=A0A0M3K8D0_ANISI|nr:unnamed protein product [Anisakis simplex]
MPICVKFSIKGSPDQLDTSFVSVYAAVSCNIAPLSNIVIITVRHADIAECLSRLLPVCMRGCIPCISRRTSIIFPTSIIVSPS